MTVIIQVNISRLSEEISHWTNRLSLHTPSQYTDHSELHISYWNRNFKISFNYARVKQLIRI